MRTRRYAIQTACLIIILISITIASPAASHGSFSGNQQYGAASCHGENSLTVSITVESSPASSVTLSPSQNLTVWVNVTGTITGDAMGVLIASNTADTGSLPTENGWTILVDPSGGGTQYNYYKMPSYSGSGSFRWILKVPASNGNYPIYALALHSGSTEYHKAATPVTFTVGTQAVPGQPSVAILSPSNGASVSGMLNISAQIQPGTGASITSATLKIDGVTVGTKTSGPFVWNIDTSTYSKGAHAINITAVDSDTHVASQEISVTFVSPPQVVTLDDMAWTAIAGSVAIVAACAVLVLTVLFLSERRRQ